MTTEERQPLWDRRAESAVLGAILLDNACIADADVLEPTHFYQEGHRTIFRAMKTLAQTGQAIDPVTLSNFLTTENKIEKIGGGSTLIQLLNDTPAAANVEHYVDIVRGNAALRHVVDVSRSVIDLCYKSSPLMGLEEIADEGETKLQAALNVLRRGKLQHRGHAWVNEAFEHLRDTYEKAKVDPDSVRSTITTTYPSLDAKVEFPGDNLTVIGGRPGMGKSALAVNLIRNYAELGDVPYLFVLEDATREQLYRYLSQISRVPATRIRRLLENRAINPDQAHDLNILLELMEVIPKHLRFGFDDTPNVSIESIRVKAKQRVREGATHILIDHALKVRRPRWLRETRDQVSYIVEQAAALAMELDVPVILFTQLKRLEKDRRPTYDDLKETGTFEESARAIILIYREEYALSQKKGKDINYPHPMELSVPKANHWTVGRAYTMYEPTRTLIREPTPSELDQIIISREQKIPYEEVVRQFTSSSGPF